MKRIAAIATTGALALSLSLAGCGAKPVADETSTEANTEATEVVGGYTVSDEAAATTLTDDERAAFDAAIDGLVGVTYTPVSTLATQVVAGTNYAFLCKGEVADAQGTTGWYVLVVYEDLSGKAELTSAEQIDLADVHVTDEAADGEAVGAWAIVMPETTELLPAEAAEAFAKATGKYDGVNLQPLATLGTQVVAGTNYLVLCAGEPTTANPVTQLYVAEVYSDLDGNAELSDVQTFDLLSYIDN